MELAYFKNLTGDDKKRVLLDYRNSILDRIIKNLIGVNEVNDDGDVGAQVEEDSKPYPLLEMQQAFLVSRFLTRSGDYVGCHVYFEFEVQNLDIERLKNSWDKIVSRHMMLRMMICSNGTQKLITDYSNYQFKLHDLGGNNTLESVREKMSSRVYEADEWPLFDIQISRENQNSYTVHFSIDEWIADGPSIGLLMEEWYGLYSKPLDTLPTLRSNFQQYINNSVPVENEERLAADLSYWKKKMALVQHDFLKSYIREELIGKPIKRHRMTEYVEAQVWATIKTRCAEISVSPTIFLLTVYSYVISKIDGNTIPLAITVSNRSPVVDRVEDIVGPFMSSNVFLSKFDSDKSLQNLLEAQQKLLWNDLDHGSVSGIEIIRKLKTQKFLPRDFNMYFVFTSMLGNFYKNKNSWISSSSYFVTQTPQVYLDHQIYEKDDELVLNWDVAADIFKEGVVEGVIDLYVDLVRCLGRKTVVWGEVDLNSLINLRSIS